MNYGYKRQVNLSYEAAVGKMRESLKTEGFGVITEIDVTCGFLNARSKASLYIAGLLDTKVPIYS